MPKDLINLFSIVYTKPSCFECGQNALTAYETFHVSDAVHVIRRLDPI